VILLLKLAKLASVVAYCRAWPAPSARDSELQEVEHLGNIRLLKEANVGSTTALATNGVIMEF